MPIPANAVNANNIQQIDYGKIYNDFQDKVANGSQYVYVTKNGTVKTEGWFSHLFTTKATINRTYEYLQKAFQNKFEKSLEEGCFENTFPSYIKNGTQADTDSIKKMINNYTIKSTIKNLTNATIDNAIATCSKSENYDNKNMLEALIHNGACRKIITKKYETLFFSDKQNIDTKYSSTDFYKEKAEKNINNFISTMNKYINDVYSGIKYDIEDGEIKNDNDTIKSEFKKRLYQKMDEYSGTGQHSSIFYAMKANMNPRFARTELINLDSLIDVDRMKDEAKIADAK